MQQKPFNDDDDALWMQIFHLRVSVCTFTIIVYIVLDIVNKNIDVTSIDKALETTFIQALLSTNHE